MRDTWLVRAYATALVEHLAKRQDIAVWKDTLLVDCGVPAVRPQLLKLSGAPMRYLVVVDCDNPFMGNVTFMKQEEATDSLYSLAQQLARYEHDHGRDAAKSSEGIAECVDLWYRQEWTMSFDAGGLPLVAGSADLVKQAAEAELGRRVPDRQASVTARGRCPPSGRPPVRVFRHG